MRNKRNNRDKPSKTHKIPDKKLTPNRPFPEKKDKGIRNSANKILKTLVGNTIEEKLGHFEIIRKSEQFNNKYPGNRGKDISVIVQMKLYDQFNKED